jgi:hypothetical protein
VQKRRKRSVDSVFSEKTRVEELFEKPLSEWSYKQRHWLKNVHAILYGSYAGRPPKAEYDHIHYKREVAKALGLKVPTLKELAQQNGIVREQEKGESAIRERPLDRVVQADYRRKRKKKSLQIPAPPTT